MNRKIIHIDMDAFYASVEQRDNPKLRGKPVIVGGRSESRGVVATCSYEARQYGIRSAMPTSKALRLCPHAILISPRFETYRAISGQIRTLMLAITPLVEPLSLDEAYLDVTNNQHERGSAIRIAERLRQEIYSATELTASAGVSYNKMLAKIASDLNKPNGLSVILPEQGADFIATLPIEKIHGIGKATTTKMHQMRIKTGADLKAAGEALLIRHFGKMGFFYYQIACGNDPREVKPQRERKSIGVEKTFAQDLTHPDNILAALYEKNHEAFSLLREKQQHAKTLTIKLKYSDFSQITRSHSINPYFMTAENADYWIAELYRQIPTNQGVRLVGVSYSNFTERSNAPQQMSLFHIT